MTETSEQTRMDTTPEEQVNAGAPEEEVSEAIEAKPEEEHEPTYSLRRLSGNDTLKVYRMVRKATSQEELQRMVLNEGFQDAQGAIIEALFDLLETDLLPFMIGMVEKEKNRFDGIEKLRFEDLEKHLTEEEQEELAELEKEMEEEEDKSEKRYMKSQLKGERARMLEKLRSREVWERTSEWMDEQPGSAPIDLFNDLCAHDSFLSVFASASRSARLVKKVSTLLGIDFEKISAISQTENSENGQSSESPAISNG